MQEIDNAIDFDSYAHRDAFGADVKSAANYLDAVVDEFYGDKATGGARMPWRDLHWFKFRSHELSIWSGYNGHGKSLLLGQVMLSIMNQDFRVCVASMEMAPGSTLGRMARQALRVYAPTHEQLKTVNDWSDGRLWVFDQMGSVSVNRMLGVIAYSQKELGVQHFVVDSLMKCGIGPDDFTAESAFTEELTSLSRDTGIHIHLVHHGRKPMNENTRMSKYEIRGSGQITDKADNVLLVSRNKKKEREAMYEDADLEILKQPDAWLTIDKQRHGTGEEGDFPLWYSKEAMTFQARHATGPIHLVSDLEATANDDEQEASDVTGPSNTGRDGGRTSGSDPVRSSPDGFRGDPPDMAASGESFSGDPYR